MKVVHIVTRDLGRRYGAAENIYRWMEWEHRNGFEVVLVAGGIRPWPDDPWLRVREVGSLVRSIDPRRDVAAFREIRDILDDERPDLVHTHHSKAGIIGRLAVQASGLRTEGSRSRRTRVMHTVHMASFGRAYGMSSPVFRSLERWCARVTDEFVAVGSELRTLYLAAGVGAPERFHVIHSPAGVERFLDTRGWSDGQRRAVRLTRGLPTDRPLILAAGLLEERKRHALLIEQVAPLLRAGRADLVIAGDGPLRDDLEDRCRRLEVAEQVHFVGYVAALEDLVATADVFVHTARVEGVPQTVLQALAAGVPVVATWAEGVREVAGDPVKVVDVQGRGLQAAVRDALDRPERAVVPAHALAPWTVSEVEARRAALYRDLALTGPETALAEPAAPRSERATPLPPAGMARRPGR